MKVGPRQDVISLSPPFYLNVVSKFTISDERKDEIRGIRYQKRKVRERERGFVEDRAQKSRWIPSTIFLFLLLIPCIHIGWSLSLSSLWMRARERETSVDVNGLNIWRQRL